MNANTLRIGITGADGFLGYHARCYFHSLGVKSIRLANRATFSSEEALQGFVRECDVVLHLAGVNRGSDAEIEQGNVWLAEALVKALRSSRSLPHVFFASSSQTLWETLSVYGKAKIQASKALDRWSKDSGARFTNLILPHLYGEFGRPFYNSAIATFCYQLANNEVPKVIVDKEIHPLHCQEVLQGIHQALEAPDSEIELKGKATSIAEVADLLQGFHAQYQEGYIPSLQDRSSLYLFNTYRSYLFPKFYPIKAKVHADPRGTFYEALRAKAEGQVSVSSTRPSVVRGEHYHTRKIERFCVVEGKALIKVRRLFSQEIFEFCVTGEEPVFVDMPTLHTHNIQNAGESPLLTVFWINGFFDPQDPDTYPENV